jgi:thiamine biosynthesis lipoprotein
MVRVGQPVMGTVLQVTVVAPDGDAARRLAEEAVAEARRWDDVLTTWRPQGELARFNAQAGQGPVKISAELKGALRTMQRFAADTGGAFDPAVGRLVRMWSADTPPAARDLDRETLDRIDRALVLGDETASLAAGVALDAGGIGKGIALDAIAAKLRAAGVRAAFLDFGGSSQLALGAAPERHDGWQVLVAALDPGRAHGVLALADAALSTSRSTGPGAKEGPIVDPRRREPVTERRVATVLASDATSAEAWSTALIVQGRPGVAAARKAGLEVLFEDAAGVLRSDGFRIGPIPGG